MNENTTEKSPAAQTPAPQPSIPVVSAASSGSSAEKEPLYGLIPGVPTQSGAEGICFDFNSGLRVMFPQSDRRYRLKFWDDDTGVLMYDSETKPGTIITSMKKYYIRYRIEISRAGDPEAKPIFSHTTDLRDQKVVVQMPVSTLGDSIAWFSYLERFQKRHSCRLFIVANESIRGIFARQYPEFVFISKKSTTEVKSYAMYYLGLFFNGDVDHQPVDFRQVGLHETAGMILGLRGRDDLAGIPPRVDLSAKRTIQERYAVIATKGTAQCKFWNNPNGWYDVIGHLRDDLGLRVLCIDKDRVYGVKPVLNHIPWGCEDFTGARPLQERIDLIKDAEVFVGLGSGLSWLAWCCRVPVVLISGFSLPYTEFYTPYRVVNYNVCNGCWNDLRVEFDHKDFMWCPRHKGDDRQFECTRMITGKMVNDMIDRIPGIADGQKPETQKQKRKNRRD